jgi:single-strand DNA-binding protein
MNFKNQVLIAGFLRERPALRKTRQEDSVTNFFLVTRKDYTSRLSKDKAHVENTIKLTAWRALAETLVQKASKGDFLEVKGEISVKQSYGSEGELIFKTEIIANSIQFVSVGSEVGAAHGKSVG